MVKRSAYSLIPNDAVFIEQVEGEIITHTTPATITATWAHGPCITILTERGYVELDELDNVEVAE